MCRFVVQKHPVDRVDFVESMCLPRQPFTIQLNVLFSEGVEAAQAFGKWHLPNFENLKIENPLWVRLDQRLRVGGTSTR